MHASCFFFNQVCLIYFGANQVFKAGEDYARHRVMDDKFMIKDKMLLRGYIKIKKSMIHAVDSESAQQCKRLKTTDEKQ
jgi:hypothetical protein